MRSGPPFHMSNFVKPLLQGCTVHHGNAIISSGSPLLAQWRQTADRATQLKKKKIKRRKKERTNETKKTRTHWGTGRINSAPKWAESRTAEEKEPCFELIVDGKMILI